MGQTTVPSCTSAQQPEGKGSRDLKEGTTGRAGPLWRVHGDKGSEHAVIMEAALPLPPGRLCLNPVALKWMWVDRRAGGR
jgi:hypothetical protein